jgi:hypothetical protein
MTQVRVLVNADTSGPPLRSSPNSPTNLQLSALLFSRTKSSRKKKMAFASINSTGAPIAVIEEAFATEPLLKKRVYDAIGA